MAEVELSVAVRDFRREVGQTRVFYRLMDTGFLPTETDLIHIDTDANISHSVKRRWWDLDGQVSLQLVDFWVDPPAPYDNQVSDHYTQWWTTQDGEIEQILRANGWTETREWEQWSGSRS